MPPLLDLQKNLHEGGGSQLCIHLTFDTCHMPAISLVLLAVFGTLHEDKQVSTLTKLTT